MSLMYFCGIAAGVNRFDLMAGGISGGMGRAPGGDGGVREVRWDGAEEDEELDLPLEFDEARERDRERERWRRLVCRCLSGDRER